MFVSIILEEAYNGDDIFRLFKMNQYDPFNRGFKELPCGKGLLLFLQGISMLCRKKCTICLFIY